MGHIFFAILLDTHEQIYCTMRRWVRMKTILTNEAQEQSKLLFPSCGRCITRSPSITTPRGTTIISAPEDSIPVKSSVPESMKTRKDSRGGEKEAAVEEARVAHVGELMINGPKRSSTNVLCGGGVIAVVTTNTFTYTAKTTTTITAPASIITSTVSTTTTSNSTVIPPGVGATMAITSSVQVKSTSYDCYVACITGTNCATSFFYAAGGCLLINSVTDQCCQNNQALRLLTGTTGLDDYLSHGYCGVDISNAAL
jgi:hypothetical protein